MNNDLYIYCLGVQSNCRKGMQQKQKTTNRKDQKHSKKLDLYIKSSADEVDNVKHHKIVNKLKEKILKFRATLRGKRNAPPRDE